MSFHIIASLLSLLTVIFNILFLFSIYHFYIFGHCTLNFPNIVSVLLSVFTGTEQQLLTQFAICFCYIVTVTSQWFLSLM